MLESCTPFQKVNERPMVSNAGIQTQTKWRKEGIPMNIARVNRSPLEKARRRRVFGPTAVVVMLSPYLRNLGESPSS
jgi:hypothetical protein